MPRKPLHTLRWSADHGHYELHTRDQRMHVLQPGDDDGLRVWLAVRTAVVFDGRQGRINIHHEQRPRGGRYWYAYHGARQRMKRYLGRTVDLTLARLEQVTGELTVASVPAPPGSASAHARTHIPPAESSAVPLLLATKLEPPRGAARLVVRDQLLRQLDAAGDVSLTLISAAAGWGKTTLLSAWAQRQGQHVAWLSLDELDNGVPRFWSAVIAALQRRIPQLGAQALSMLQAPEPAPPSAILTVLLNDVAALATAPLVLALDDYQVISDGAVQESVAYLIEHLPLQLRVVLATRADPDLPLARWRARGTLLELRNADLRFSAQDTGALFTAALSDQLPDAVVQRLHQRTEGWIAGLQLAALALRQRVDREAFVAAFTGSHRYLFDYVREELLARQPVAVQRFVLHTAVLRRMNAAVCTALTGEMTSQAMLEQLERSNLFVVPLDDQRRWYRLHDLVREALLARLRTTEPELEMALHRRAARWFASQQELREAIAHAFAANDFPFAAELIARAAPELWVRGEAQAVQTWIAALPDVVVVQHARLALDAALRLLEASHGVVGEVYAGVQRAVEHTISCVEDASAQPDKRGRLRSDHTADPLPAAEATLLRRRIGLLRTLIRSRPMLFAADIDGLSKLVYEVEAQASEEHEVRWQLVATAISFWLIESFQGQGALLLPRLLQVKDAAVAAGDQHATLRVMRLLAMAYGRAGRLQLAEQECHEALALSERLGEQSAGTGYFVFLLVGMCYARHRLDDAMGYLDQLRHIATLWQQLDLLRAAYELEVLIALARHDVAAAAAALHDMDALIRQQRSAYHAGIVAELQVTYWLATGNLDAARAWAAQVQLPDDLSDRIQRSDVLMLIRVYLAQQQAPAALALIDRFSADLDRPGDSRTTIQVLALQLIALHQTGQLGPARDVATRLLDLTAPDDYVSVYLDAGEPMRHALHGLIASQRGHAVGFTPAAAAFVDRVLAAFAQAPSPSRSGLTPGPLTYPSDPSDVPALAYAPPVLPDHLEALTRREQEVLRWLLAGASNSEIADHLVISRATVKKHVGNLFAKLGVANRSQVIARARDWWHLV